jgi:mRNA interferase RelE/StbE
MPKYTVVITKKAQKQLNKLPNNAATAVLTDIGKLETNPRPPGYIKLKGREGYRIRIGDYRVIYDIHDKELIVDVIALGNRREIYD